MQLIVKLADSEIENINFIEYLHNSLTLDCEGESRMVLAFKRIGYFYTVILNNNFNGIQS